MSNAPTDEELVNLMRRAGRDAMVDNMQRATLNGSVETKSIAAF